MGAGAGQPFARAHRSSVQVGMLLSWRPAWRGAWRPAWRGAACRPQVNALLELVDSNGTLWSKLAKDYGSTRFRGRDQVGPPPRMRAPGRKGSLLRLVRLCAVRPSTPAPAPWRPGAGERAARSAALRSSPRSPAAQEPLPGAWDYKDPPTPLRGERKGQMVNMTMMTVKTAKIRMLLACDNYDDNDHDL